MKDADPQSKVGQELGENDIVIEIVTRDVLGGFAMAAIIGIDLFDVLMNAVDQLLLSRHSNNAKDGVPNSVRS